MREAASCKLQPATCNLQPATRNLQTASCQAEGGGALSPLLPLSLPCRLVLHPVSYFILEHCSAEPASGNSTCRAEQMLFSLGVWGVVALSDACVRHNKVTVVACMMHERHEICPSKDETGSQGTDDGSASHFSRHEKEKGTRSIRLDRDITEENQHYRWKKVEEQPTRSSEW